MYVSLPTTTGAVTRLLTVPICPDLLDYAAIGEADGPRGRIVRAFFWLLQAWPTERRVYSRRDVG